MSKEDLINTKIVLLDVKDVSKVTGWCEQIVRRLFAYDDNFPAIKKGKKYQVEADALKEYLSTRRIND